MLLPSQFIPESSAFAAEQNGVIRIYDISNRTFAPLSVLTLSARDMEVRGVFTQGTTAEFVVARDLGFDLVQGFLFRDRARVALR